MKRIVHAFIGAALFAVLVLALDLHSVSVRWALANTNWSSFTYCLTGGSLCRGDYNRFTDYGINVLEFSGIDPSGSADSTAAIQAAIDCSFGTGMGCSSFTSGKVYIPAGVYKTTQPIFDDPPGNLRGKVSYVTSANSTVAATTALVLGGSDTTNGLYAGMQISGTDIQAGTFIASITDSKNIVMSQAGSGAASNVVITFNGAWSNSVGYAQNYIVSYNGIPWVSLDAGTNTGNTPSVSSTHWASTTITPTNGSVTPSLTGVAGLPSNAYGASLHPQFNNAPILWTSTGNGHTVSNLDIYASAALTGSAAQRYNCGLPPAGISGAVAGANGGAVVGGVGIAIPSGTNGASGTTIENVRITDVFASIMVGADGISATGSENYFRNVWNNNACIGIWFSTNEVFTNSVVDSHICGTIAYYAVVGGDVRISHGDTGACGSNGKTNSFTVGSTGSFSISGNNVTFNTTITLNGDGNDSYLTVCATAPSNIGMPLGSLFCNYNTWTMISSYYGVVPLILKAYNSSTQVATFQTLPMWGQQNFATLSATDLQADLTAVTTIYTAEQVTLFYGGNISADGLHIEVQVPPTLIADTYQAVGSATNTVRLQNIMLNYGPDETCSPYPCSAANLSTFLTAQSFPTFYVQTTNLTGRNISSAQGTNNIIIDVLNTKRFDFQQVGLKPNMRVSTNGGGPFTQYYYSWCGPAYGCGTWDVSPFVPIQNSDSKSMRTVGWTSGQAWGVRPALNSTPRITPTTLTTTMGCTGGPPLTCTLPAISPSANISYPLLSGDVFYSLGPDWNSGSLTHAFFHSSHKFYSYGQPLTTSNVTGLNWTYKGQSWVVYLCANAPGAVPGQCTANETALLGMMFPGLGVQFNCGTDCSNTDETYMVTGVYPGLGYITVLNANQDGGPNGLVGTKTTVYTCPSNCPVTQINQQLYSITEYP
jgi:hypothetical protein